MHYNKNKEERLLKTAKLIEKLNELIGQGPDKVISQRELSRQLGYGNSAVCRWLSGEHAIGLEHAIVLCDFFGLDIKEYMDTNFEVNDELVLPKSKKMIRLIELDEKISVLSKKNQEKLYDYINYLLYIQEIEKEQNKLVRKIDK